MNASPTVGVVMGSKSDYEVLLPCLDLLREFAIPLRSTESVSRIEPPIGYSIARQAEPRGTENHCRGRRRRSAFAWEWLPPRPILPVLAFPFLPPA